MYTMLCKQPFKGQLRIHFKVKIRSDGEAEDQFPPETEDRAQYI